MHFLPHHGVLCHDSETTRLQIVYNVYAKGYGSEQSFNDYLQTEPNYISKLSDILIQFRWHKIAIAANIKKAFLMIHISEADQDFLRFLWVRNPFKVPHEPVHLQFTQLVLGMQSYSAILREKLLYHIDKYQFKFPELTKQLKNSFYVDDLVG